VVSRRVDTAASVAEPGPSRRAIIWLSGLAEGTVDQSAQGVARRLAVALDLAAETGAARFSVEVDDRATDLESSTSCTIVRTDDGVSNPFLDVVRLATETTLTDDFARRGLVFRAALAAWVFFKYLPKMTVGARRKLKVWFGRSKESSQNPTGSILSRSSPEGEVAAVPDAVGTRRLRSAGNCSGRAFLCCFSAFTSPLWL
jgi:hypothetical protein